MNISRTIRIILPLAFAILAIAAVAQDQAVPAKPVTEEVVATPAPKPLAALELANLKVDFLRVYRQVTQAQLELTAIKEEIGDDKLKRLQEAAAKVDPKGQLMTSLQAAFAPLRASCKAGENFDPESLECQAPPPQQMQAAPAPPPPAKKPPAGKK